MTNSSTNSVSADEIEQLLGSLNGVRSARVLIEEPGRIDEIHVLCSPALQTKQVVRNIESALSAGLGIHIDRRIVSVAQLREELGDLGRAPATPASRAAAAIAAAPEGTTAPAPRASEPVTPSAETAAAGAARQRRARAAVPPGAAPKRFVFVGFDARTQAGTTHCRVTLRRGRRELEGHSSGPNTGQGRASAAAEALFDAVARADDVGRITLDGAVVVELATRPFVLVSAVGADGRAGV
jgi:hypothetical protein